MPRIPVPDETVQFQAAMMPGSSGGGYSAVGEAVKGFGNAISDASAAFAAKTEQEDDFEDKLALLDWQNNQSIDAIKAQREYNRDNPRGFATERHGAREQSFRNDLIPKLKTEKGRKQAELFWRGTGHNFYEGDFRFEQSQRENKLFRDTGAAITNGFASIDAKTPEATETAMLDTMAGIDAMIKAAPMSLERKEALAKEAAQLALARLRESFTDAEGRVTDKFYEAARRLMTAASVPTPVPVPRPGAPATAQPISSFEGPVPSSSERKKIFAAGGVVVNLDTNWSPRKDSQTGPLVVIPDDATPVQRQAAQAYVDAIASAYQEKFGTSLPGKVLTRSENGRGRAATMHTEPFAVTDGKAVEYFIKSPEGRGKLAAITNGTLGRIPGVQFSLPHDEERGDKGAHGDHGNEVEHAKALLAEMKAGATSAPGGSGPAGPGGVKGQFKELLIRGMPQYAKEADVAQERWAKELEIQAKTIMDLAEKGYATVDQVSQLRKAVEQRPDLASRFGLAEAATAIESYARDLEQMRVMTPIELQQAIQAVDGQIRKAPAGTPPAAITQAVKRKERMTTLLGRMSEGVANDPHAWADQVGLVPLKPLDFERLNPEALEARIGSAMAISERYGIRPQYFTKVERDQLSEKLKVGGKPMLALLGTLSKSLGPSMIDAMGEVSKTAPEAATIGWMMTEGINPTTIEDAAEGMARQARRATGEKSIAAPPLKDERAAFIDVFGPTFQLSPRSEAAVIETARAIYEVRAQRRGLKEPDTGLWTSILKEVVGETRERGITYGGVYFQTGGMFSGTSDPVIVPPNMRNDTFGEVMKLFVSPLELVMANPRFDDQPSARPQRGAEPKPGDERPGAGQLPSSEDGRPLTMDRLRRAKLISVGNSSYALSFEPSSSSPKFVKDGQGRDFVIDLRRVEDLLRKRRAALFKGYVAPEYAMPKIGQ